MNNNMIGELSLYITKSSLSDGIMRWSAINSDTESDLYGEKMTLELYQKMLGYIKNGTPPPREFQKYVCSDYWCGGMPYVSLAHYPDMNGKAVLGEPTELFIDGKQLKAKGILFDTPLGRATWKSLKEDEKLSLDDERIRISIAFLDLAHKHGEEGKVFERLSRTSICTECSQGIGDKIYLDGYLVHLATTRKPVNTRTIMEAEENIMARKAKIETRRDDALSIVQDESLVDEIEQGALESKSDILVEMSDTEDAPIEQVLALESKPSPKEDEDDESDDAQKEKKTYKSELTVEELSEVIRSTIREMSTPVVGDLPAPVVDVNSPINQPITQKNALDVSVDKLYDSINSALQMDSTYEQKLESLNPVLAELGESIKSVVREKGGYTTPTTVANDNGQILEAIAELSAAVKGVSQEVATMKAEQSKTPSVNRVPVPRSIQPLTNISTAQETLKPVNPNSVANIVRRSVSSQLPLT